MLASLIYIPLWLISRLEAPRWYYDIYAENHLNETVTVRIWTTEHTDGFITTNTVIVPPCTVCQRNAIGPPDGLDLAAQGARREAREFEHAVGELHDYTLPVSVWIVGREAGGCPEAIEGQYMLHINNRTAEDLAVVYQGQEIGIALLDTATEFGPFDGEWRDFDAYDVAVTDGAGGYRTGAGGDLVRKVAPVEYALGQTPIITVSIQSMLIK
jgi:hypothetical protein